MFKTLSLTVVAMFTMSVAAFANDAMPSTLTMTTAPSPLMSMQPRHVPKGAFTTEQAAQAHCPSDTVVWVNMHSGAVHQKTSKYYGKTKHGVYACKAEVTAQIQKMEKRMNPGAMRSPATMPVETAAP